jgi:hypothetical protein
MKNQVIQPAKGTAFRRLAKSRNQVGLLVTLGLILGSGMASAQGGLCSNATLSGTYAAHYQGYISPDRGPGQPGGGHLPVASVIPVTFDGLGGVLPSVGAGLNVGSAEVFFEVTGGSYSVNPDCTGTLTFTTSIGRTYLHQIIVTGNGEEYRFLRLTPAGAPVGIIQSGTARRMNLAG